MSRHHRADAEALATFVRRLRPPTGDAAWGQAQTVQAILASREPLSETAVALIRLAEDATVQSPSLLNQDGHWWYRAARGEQPAGQALRASNTCPEHPRQPMGECAECRNEAGRELTPDEIAQAAHAIRIGLPNYTPPPDRTAPLTRDMTTARERADQEQP